MVSSARYSSVRTSRRPRAANSTGASRLSPQKPQPLPIRMLIKKGYGVSPRFAEACKAAPRNEISGDAEAHHCGAKHVPTDGDDAVIGALANGTVSAPRIAQGHRGEAARIALNAQDGVSVIVD